VTEDPRWTAGRVIGAVGIVAACLIGCALLLTVIGVLIGSAMGGCQIGWVPNEELGCIHGAQLGFFGGLIVGGLVSAKIVSTMGGGPARNVLVGDSSGTAAVPPALSVEVTDVGTTQQAVEEVLRSRASYARSGARYAVRQGSFSVRTADEEHSASLLEALKAAGAIAHRGRGPAPRGRAG
jgi:hypothetical protein